ncbi:MAG: T9SS type A sorting domain-containing protein, partial [Bacteroidales bacterium]|nr:T9SS type A sorting domain-containing protein [Bacteroidales bacterium]
PVKNILYSLAFTSVSTVFIYNTQGRLVNECRPDNSQIDLSHLPSGLYYFYIFDGNRNSKGKFVRD